MTVLVRMLCILLVLGVTFFARPVAASTTSCAVLQLGGLDLSHAQSLLPQMQSDHACGFLLDHGTKTHGQDDILNGGAPSTEGGNYAAYLASSQATLQDAASDGLTQTYVRLNWDVYAPGNPTGQQYKFDIFSTSELTAYAQSWFQQGSFARSSGLAGIWFDGEPYDYRYAWDEGSDTTMPASSHTPAQVAQQYVLLGQIAARQILSAYPAMHMVLMPGFAYTVSAYVHYPDWYAGFLSIMQAHNAAGVILATESTTGVDSVTQPTLLSYLANYELGTQANGGRYSPVRTVLQAYDAAHGTTLWAYHLAHTAVSIELWPYRDANNNTAAATPDLRLTLGDFEATYQQALSLSPLVSIYSEQQASWEQPSYACYANWTSVLPPTDPTANPLLSSGTQPCPGWQMAQS